MGDDFSVRVEYVDLERMGWDFSEIYENASGAMGFSLEEAEKWEKDNCHVRIFKRCDGRIFWVPSNMIVGDMGDCMETGDDNKTIGDIMVLYAESKLWDICGLLEESVSDIISRARDVQTDLPSKMRIDELDLVIRCGVWVTEKDAIQYFYAKCDELGLFYN